MATALEMKPQVQQTERELQDEQANQARQAEHELARAACEQAQQEHLKASDAVSGYASRQAQLEGEIAELTQQYDRDCMEAAAGTGVDPGPGLAQLQAKKNLLHGTLQQRARAEATAKPLAAKATEAGRLLREAGWSIEEQRLIAATKATGADVEEGNKHLQNLIGLNAAAAHALGQFRKQVARERGESFTEPEATATILRRR